MKTKNILIMIIALCLILCSGCNKKNSSKNSDTSSNDSNSDVQSAVTLTDIDVSSMDVEFTENDQKSEYDSSKVIQSATDKDVIEITTDGVYKVSGEYTQIVVKAPDTAKPQIILSDAQINCTDGPAIHILSGDKVFLTVEGTNNSLSDGETYDASYDNADGVIFSKSDLTINGSGQLKINGKYKFGIVSKDDLTIVNTKLVIESKASGIEGKDCVKIKNADIKIDAGADGIKSTNEEESDRGYITVESGTFNINAVNDGFQAATALMINNGTFNITTGGGSQNSSSINGNENDRWGMWGGGFGGNDSSSTSDTESAKALKSGFLIKISGGEFNIDSSDDAIHSNSDTEINGGTINISSGDDGIHSDDQLIINDINLIISKSYEGIEATAITVNGGNIDVTASDDGFNAAGGNDSSALGGRPGQNLFESDSEAIINFCGGYIHVNASGDGIDSNGNIKMTDGILLVSGPENSGNGAFDYGGKAEIDGGTAVIVGSSGMATTFADSSAQPSFMYNADTIFEGGTPLSVLKNGKTVVTFTPQKRYNSIIVSSPSFKLNETYSLNLGGKLANADKHGYSDNGKHTDFTANYEIELTSISTSNSMQGGMGGMRPGGGMEKPNRGDSMGQRQPF